MIAKIWRKWQLWPKTVSTQSLYVLFYLYILDVHVVVDCCSSRSLVDRKYAFEALKEAGAYLSTSERIILGLAPDAAHPKFRQLQKIVMTSAEDTGLLWTMIK